jgi:Tfp pilus assembly protein FimT
MKRTKGAGVSLLELVFAIGLLAVAIVSLPGVFSVLIACTTKTTDLSAGVMFAQKVLEEAVVKGNPVALKSGSEGIYTHDSANKTTFHHILRCTHVLDNDNPVLGQAWYYEVEVYWWSDDPDRYRANMGRTSTRVGRMVYPILP